MLGELSDAITRRWLIDASKKKGDLNRGARIQQPPFTGDVSIEYFQTYL